RPRPPSPRRARDQCLLASGRGRLGRAAPMPVGARRPARGDLPAPHRVRPPPDRRVQRRPRFGDHGNRAVRGAREARVRSHELRRTRDRPSAGGELARHRRRGARDDRPCIAGSEVAMFGLDDRIASYSNGTTLLIVVGVSILLGLRHASDPDHLAAVTTLVASSRERAARRAAKLGLAWGLGHATSLFVFGLPVVLYSAYLPEPVQRAAETTVGFVIVGLALLLLVRWRRGVYRNASHAHRRPRGGRQAYAIGVVHGMGGTAGVGLL